MASALIPVPEGAVELVFDYDFASKEFDSYVGGRFDDELHVTVAGDEHSIPLGVASVNGVGKVDSVPVKLSPTLQGFEHTGWRTQRVNLQGMTGHIVFAATVTDVGDTDYDTIVWIDNLRFE